MTQQQQSDKAAQLMTNLEQEWKALESQEAKSTIGMDENRAALLARYEKKEDGDKESNGLTQREIATSIKLSRGHVDRLLRYHRYLTWATLHPMGCKIPERTFRTYWEQVRDPSATKGKRKIDPAYEEKCFKAIAEMVETGKKPYKVKKVKEVKPKDVKTLKQFHKTAKEFYEERLKPTLDKLKSLLHCDRSTFAPAVIAGHAQVLEREIPALLQLLTGTEES